MTNQQQTKQQISQYQIVKELINRYNVEPENFTDEEIFEIQKVAATLGIPFSPKFSTRRALGKGAFELLDSALFGILPNEWSPPALTKTEELFGTAGDIGGAFALPLAAGSKLAAKAMGAITSGEKINTFANLLKKIPKYGSEMAVAGTKADIFVGNRLKQLAKILDTVEKQQAAQRFLAYGTAFGTKDLLEEGLDPSEGIVGGGAAALLPYLKQLKLLSVLKK